MAKRGLSNIVVTVLVILFALIATSIVGIVLKNVADDAGEKTISGAQYALNFDVPLSSVFVNHSSKLVRLVIERKAGQGDLDGFLIILEDNLGNSQTYRGYENTTIAELESLQIVFTHTLAGNVTTITVAPVTRSGGTETLGGGNTERIQVNSGGRAGGGGGGGGGSGGTPPTPAVCGNNVIESGEACDGSSLPYTCASLGLTSGTLRCTASCQLNTTECTGSQSPPQLVNIEWLQTGIAEGQSADIELIGVNASSQNVEIEIWEDDSGFGDDYITTLSENFDSQGNSLSVPWPTEWQCDGGESSGSCLWGDPEYYLKANFTTRANSQIESDHNFNLQVSQSNPQCGNGYIQSGEQCEGSNLNGQTCQTQGFTGGTLSCSASCQLVNTSCTLVTGQCTDGTDNDGDGLTDWQYDLGCYGPSDNTEGGSVGMSRQNGWTVIEPSTDTQIIYVSDSVGSDSYTGLCPNAPTSGLCGPKKTTYAGSQLLRNGFPDWMLIRRGDTFFNQSLGPNPETQGHLNRNGKNGRERLVISTYGASTQRPKVYSAFGAGQFADYDPQNIIIAGIEMNNYEGNPYSPYFKGIDYIGSALTFQYQVKNITIEDNVITGYDGAVYVDAVPGSTLASYMAWDNIEVRRNVIYNIFPTYSHSNAIFTLGGGNLTLEENMMYKNGWTDVYDMIITSGTGYNVSSAWQGVTNGDFIITLDETDYIVTGANFASVANMNDVAQVLENRINTAISGIGTMDVQWLPFRGQFMFSSTLQPTDDYGIKRYTAGAGTDIADTDVFLNNNSVSTPGKTIFNRDMYISGNFNNTFARGNIVVEGASGGIQLRMGGIMEDNLAIRQPWALTFGHDQNPDINLANGAYGQNEFQVPFSGIARNNVVLDSEDIGNAPRGLGLGLGGTNVEAYNNIISSNTRGHDAYGMAMGGSIISPLGNARVYNNVIYNWFAGSGTNAGIYIIGNLGTQPHNSTLVKNVSIFNNIIQQNTGKAIDTVRTVAAWRNQTTQWNYQYDYLFRQINFSNNTYYSSAGQASLFRIGEFNNVQNSAVTSASALGTMNLASWAQYTNDTSRFANPGFVDPDRGVETYMASLGQTPTYDAFVSKILAQSRFNWDNDYTAYTVNQYIRDGFATA